jgi:hypothetical protein
MNEKQPDAKEKERKPRATPTVSTVLESGAMVEMVYRPEERQTAYVVFRDGDWAFEKSIALSPEELLVPYRAENNLLRHGVVLLPSEPEEYGTEDELLSEIRAFIHRYVDMSPLFEEISSYYVLLSWIYDSFNELPYLRARGDFGSGKTRLLLTVGSLCYKPIFASGASTISPIFRILDSFRGTLVIDEGDFRASDEKAEIVKILNQGNAKGFPVLRSEAVDKKEFDPRAYSVFGPKIVATRGYFEDRALESRFLTEEMGHTKLRKDIPINLPERHKEDALHLRNKLLLFRFRKGGKTNAVETIADSTLEPRLNQIFAPLLSVIADPTARENLRDLARRYNRELVSDRGLDTEAEVLEVIRELAGSVANGKIAIKEIAVVFAERHENEYERAITPKWIGGVLRKKLHLHPRKSDGVYVIDAENSILSHLYEKFGILEGNVKTIADDPGVDIGTSGTLIGDATPTESPGIKP